MGNINCYHDRLADTRLHDGGLSHVIGCSCYQVVRAARDVKESPEGKSFTYKHAAMLTYWNECFLYEYLVGPIGEHESPSAVYLCRSKDGIHWSKPEEIFPPIEVTTAPYKGPGKEFLGVTTPCVVHHRMGFYTSKSGRLLVSTFYGISPVHTIAPNNGYGVGRVVREIYPDFSMSDIYFLRYNEPGGYHAGNVQVFDSFKNASDLGFVAACEELISDKLVTQQWWEEECLDQEFFTRPDGRALSYYTLPNGDVMGVFKKGFTSISKDKGLSWSELEKSESLITSTGKVWGERTSDGKYALMYNPSPDGAHRWPLAITVGENGRDFYGLYALVPEISPCRYEGNLKNLGAQYMRGITEANMRPKEQASYLAYSVNKEDMWILRVPIPVKADWGMEVHEDMSTIAEKDFRDTWNLYVPSWGDVCFTQQDGRKVLCLTDEDPYNRTKAERIFKKSDKVSIHIDMSIAAIGRDKAWITIQNESGQDVLQFTFLQNGSMALHEGGRDITLLQCGNEEICIDLKMECRTCAASLDIHTKNQHINKKINLDAIVHDVERIVIATKQNLPFQGLQVNGKFGNIGNLPNPDTRHPKTIVYVSKIDISYDSTK